MILIDLTLILFDQFSLFLYLIYIYYWCVCERIPAAVAFIWQSTHFSAAGGFLLTQNRKIEGYGGGGDKEARVVVVVVGGEGGSWCFHCVFMCVCV